MEFDRDLRARQEVRLLAQQAQQAFEGLQKLDQSGLDRITEALSRAGALHAAELAREACAETGFGNERDKTEKNRFAAVRVFGAIRGLRTVGILRRDDERRVWDVGVPVGVIAGIVPSTNPTSTVIYKSLIALKAGRCNVTLPMFGLSSSLFSSSSSGFSSLMASKPLRTGMPCALASSISAAIPAEGWSIPKAHSSEQPSTSSLPISRSSGTLSSMNCVR